LRQRPYTAGGAATAAANGQCPNGGLGVLALSQANIYGKYLPKPNNNTFDLPVIDGEMFAETFAYLSGNAGPNDRPSVPCTYTLAQYLFQTGAVNAGTYGFTYLGPATMGTITYDQYYGPTGQGQLLPSSGPANLPFTSNMGNCPAN
jgi:hypothetical protein